MKVKEFFERDDVGRLCPGKKDCVSVKLEDGRKEKVQEAVVVKLEGDLRTFCNRKPFCESWILCICHATTKVVCTLLPVGSSSGTHKTMYVDVHITKM